MPRPRRPIKVKTDKVKTVKPKPVVSGSTGVVEYTGVSTFVRVNCNGLYVIVPVELMPLGFKVGDSIICRFQLVKGRNVK